MGICRTQVVFPHKSGLARDAAVNVFHHVIAGTTPTETERTDIRNNVKNFYNFTHATSPNTRKVAHWMSPTIDRANCVMKHYRADGAPPHLPVDEDYIWTLDNGIEANPLPSEVAMCLSFYGSVNAPTRRGRLFIGPLVPSIMEVDSTTKRVAVAQLARDTLKATALKHIADTAAANVQWCVFSRKNQLAHIVTNGWVDDAVDIQRRRGEDATTRTTF